MLIIAKSPSRISLFGGGTDLISYSSRFGGITISMSINLYSSVKLYTGDDIFKLGGSVFPNGVDPSLAYSILTNAGIGSGHHSKIETSYDGVIGAGLGSSASFSVALLAAIKRSKGERIEDRTKLANDAWMEENKMGWYGGRQDQVAASYGGLNVITFGKNIELTGFNRMIGDNLLQYLHLFYTGGKRDSHKIQRKLEKLTPEKIHYLNQIKDIAIIGQKALFDGRMELAGKLLHASWEAKKGLGVSNEKIDSIYAQGREAGAIGGKLLGAGESGYMIFWVSPQKKKKFLEEMSKIHLEKVDFEIDYQGCSSRIL